MAIAPILTDKVIANQVVEFTEGLLISRPWISSKRIT